MIFPQTTSKALRSIEVGFFFHPTFTWVWSKMGDAPERAILEKWMDHHGSTMKCWHFMGISNSFPTKKPSKTHLIRSVSTATRWFFLALGPRGISHNGSRSPPHGRTSWCQRWQLNDAWRCPEFGAGQGPVGPIQCPMAVKNWGFTIWLFNIAMENHNF